MSIVLVGSTSGSVTLQEPAVAGTTVIDLPATSGTMVVTGGAQTVQFAAGTSSAPSITFTGDTNTGIFSPGADTIAFTEGGVESMRIDSSGNVGIGTSTPTSGGVPSKLRVRQSSDGTFSGVGIESSTSTSELIYIANTGSRSVIGQTYLGGGGAYQPVCFDTSNTERVRITTGGDFLVGSTTSTGIVGFQIQSGNTSAANSGFQVLSSTTGTGGLYYGDGTTGVDRYQGYIEYNHNTNSMIFATSANSRMFLTSDGNLCVGKTVITDTTVGSYIGAGGKLGLTSSASTNAASTVDVYSTGAGNYRFYIGYGGTVFATSTTITAISDQRLKENITDIDVGLDAVMALKPRKFDWKDGKGKDKKGDRGWIAQEFETVFPDMIDEWKDPAPEGEEPYKAVNADLIPVLVKAIQEQQAIITDLKARIETLENK